jgi:TetR/AcrR family transcriptional regulator, fatty acid metabolism regulator protein
LKDTTMPYFHNPNGEEQMFNKESLPPGGIKLIDTLKMLLKDKEFNAITTAEIAKVAGVNEALIYKYFGSKRGLLHAVQTDFTNHFFKHIASNLKGIEGASNKLKKIVWAHINYYLGDPVFARILVLEVRTYPGYFKSESYYWIRRYTQLVRQIIEEGVQENEIRDDIPSWAIMQTIMGGIEHLIMPNILFKRELETDQLTEYLWDTIFSGIKKKDAAA